jgi:BASS family bile acid:Na+ symporter
VHPAAKHFQTILERYLLVWLVLLCWVAYSWPAWFGLQERGAASFDPFVATKGWLGYMIAVTMLAIGSLLPREEVVQVFRRWPTVLGGTAIQYSSMPLLAYGAGRLFGLEGPWMIGIVMVGCVPGAMASNVLTMIARGNVSYSVSLTTSATILSPLVVPWVLWLALGRMVENFPVGKVFIDLCWMVVLPVVTGHLLSRAWPTWASATQRVGAIIANLTILWIIAVVVAANRGGVSQLDFWLVAALLTVNLAGYAAGYAGGQLMRLPEMMRRALTLEIGMQNAGLGTTLAMGLFADERIALPAALYTFGCMFTGTVLARIWAEWSERRPEVGNRDNQTK